MKKVFKIFVIILITVFMFGCNKAEGILTIDADKNVSMDIKIVVNKDFEPNLHHVVPLIYAMMYMLDIIKKD